MARIIIFLISFLVPFTSFAGFYCADTTVDPIVLKPAYTTRTDCFNAGFRWLFNPDADSDGEIDESIIAAEIARDAEVTSSISTHSGTSAHANVSDGDKGDVSVSGGVWSVDTANASVTQVTDSGGYFDGTNAETVLQEVGAKLASLPVYDVTDPAYGAACDGSTNDTTAIQAAIDAAEASSEGGLVRTKDICRSGALTVQSSDVYIDCGGGRLSFISETGNFISFEPADPTSTFLENAGIRNCHLTAEDGNTDDAAIYMNSINHPVIINTRATDFFGGAHIAGVWQPMFVQTHFDSGDYFSTTDATYHWKFSEQSTNVFIDRPTAVYMSDAQMKLTDSLTTFDKTLNVDTIKYGLDIEALDGGYFSNIHTNVIYGRDIYIHPGVGEFVAGAFFTNTQLDAATNDSASKVHVEIVEGSGTVKWVKFYNGLWWANTYTGNKEGAIVNGGNDIEIAGITITNQSADAVDVQSGENVKIHDNTITDNQTGITFGNSIIGWTVANNLIGTESHDGSTSSHATGLAIGTGNTDYTVNGNAFGQYNTINITDVSKAASGQICGNSINTVSGSDDYNPCTGYFATLSGGTNTSAAMVIGSGASLRSSAGILGIPNSVNLPISCSVGDVYQDSDATTGAQFYLCETTDNWVVQSGGGGGGGDITQVWATSAGDVSILTAGAGDALNASGADYSIPWVTATDCTAETAAANRACLDTDDGSVWLYNSTWSQFGGKNTGGSLASTTTVGDPGSDSNVPTEQAVREAIAAVGGSPPGSDTQVIFNDSAAFGADAAFTFDKTASGIVIESTNTTSTSRGIILRQHSNDGAGGNIAAYKSESIDNSPAAGDVISAVRNLNTYLGYGWDGDSWELGAGLYLQSEGAYTDATPNGQFKVFLDDGSTYAERFRVNSDGGVSWSNGTEPTCSATERGKSIYVQGGASVADTFRICMKNASDTYAWTTIAAP